MLNTISKVNFQRHCDFHIACSLTPSLARSERTQLSCCELPYGEANVARKWYLWSRAGKDLPTATASICLQLQHLKANSPSSEPWDEYSTGQHLDCSPVRELNPVEPWKALLRYLTLRNWEIINACCFQLLNLGVIFLCNNRQLVHPFIHFKILES